MEDRQRRNNTYVTGVGREARNREAEYHVNQVGKDTAPTPAAWRIPRDEAGRAAVYGIRTESDTTGDSAAAAAAGKTVPEGPNERRVPAEALDLSDERILKVSRQRNQRLRRQSHPPRIRLPKQHTNNEW